MLADAESFETFMVGGENDRYELEKTSNYQPAAVAVPSHCVTIKFQFYDSAFCVGQWPVELHCNEVDWGFS